SIELNNIFGINKKFKRDLNGWLQIIHPDFQEEMSNYFQSNILQQQQNFNKEYKIVSIKAKQEKWVHGLGTLKFDENNNLVEIFGTIHDITDRKRTEEALIDSEMKYRKFFMGDLTGDFLSTREGKIIDCNPQFLNIYGFKSLKQAQDYNISKLYKSNAERERFIKKLEKNQILLDEQLEQYTVNGEKIIIQENVSGEFDDDGKLINIRGYVFDITERVKAKQEVVKLSTALEQSPVSIIITDTEGIIEYVNPTFEKLTGYSFDEVIGSKPSILKSGVVPDSEYSKVSFGEQLLQEKCG
ncbi:MAG: PAS domain S-box protein, partial [Planctomycetia bacterium]|nr:PAS domain S-box protein [Planctomycetia bacterium]